MRARTVVIAAILVSGAATIALAAKGPRVWIPAPAVGAVVAIAALVAVRRHLAEVRRLLRDPARRPAAQLSRQRIVLAMDRPGPDDELAAAYAARLAPSEIRVVHVGPPSIELLQVWGRFGVSDTIDILPHIQGVAADLRSYVGRLRDQHGSEEILNVIIPEEVGRGRQSTYLLRRAKAQLIKATLLAEPGIVITNITHYDVSEVPDPREAPGWRHVAIVLVSAVHNATLRALAYARSLHADEVLCVHVATDDHESERICNDWEAWSPGSPLIVDDGRSSRISAAVLAAVDRVFGDHARMFVTVVLPEFVVSRWWHNLLHEQTALVLKRALLFEPSVVAVTSVPYRLGTDRDVPEVERELQM